MVKSIVGLWIYIFETNLIVLTHKTVHYDLLSRHCFTGNSVILTLLQRHN